MLIRQWLIVVSFAGVPILGAAEHPGERTQTPPQGLLDGMPKPPAPVERLGPDRVRVGNVQIDMAKKEISVRGTVNEVLQLEFVANTKGGSKAYESAIELDTNAVNFNLGLILIGLDNSRAVVPRFHFDPVPPQGDPVEVWVEWDESGRQRRIRAEQLVYNKESKTTLPEGPWVYTGSSMLPDGRFSAELDGALIGFVHTPAPLIENPRPVPGPFGAAIINPSLSLKTGTSVLLTVRALPREK